MFGFSLPKLLVLALIIAVIWYGFKWATQLDRSRRKKVKDEAKRAAPETPEASSDGAEDMVKCDVCGTFVAARGAKTCGRGDCPYPG
jgi:uncharacterized protein